MGHQRRSSSGSHRRRRFGRAADGTGSADFLIGWNRAPTKCTCAYFLSRYRAYTLCPQCHGTRFKPETLNFRLVIGEERLTLPDLQQMPVDRLAGRLAELRISEKDSATEVVRSQIVSRLNYLVDVGLDILPWTVQRALSPAVKCKESI